MTELTPELREKFKKVKLLALDVDGVLTDGGVYVFEDGRELRRFDIKDGAGIKRLLKKITVAIISSSNNQAVKYRLSQLGVQYIFLGVENKFSILEKLCIKLEISLDHVCYIGDDDADKGILKVVGLPVSPFDGVNGIKNLAIYITKAKGGHGCVREVCDKIYRSDNAYSK